MDFSSPLSILYIVCIDILHIFIRLRLNTLQLAAWMKSEVNRAEAHQSEGGLIPSYHCNGGVATAQFRFDTPPLAAGSFITQTVYSLFE
jgi:hypothetical protein